MVARGGNCKRKERWNISVRHLWMNRNLDLCTVMLVVVWIPDVFFRVVCDMLQFILFPSYCDGGVEVKQHRFFLFSLFFSSVNNNTFLQHNLFLKRADTTPQKGTTASHLINLFTAYLRNCSRGQIRIL